MTFSFCLFNALCSAKTIDLSKIFIEDGTYFYSQEFSKGNFFVNSAATNKNTESQRIAGSGALLYLGLY
jgi:hypothetical protein